MDTTLATHRAYLLKTLDDLSNGTVPVNVANAVVDVSEQYLRSIHQEWQMRVYTVENNMIDNAKITPILEHNPEKE